MQQPGTGIQGGNVKIDPAIQDKPFEQSTENQYIQTATDTNNICPC